jgi:hypothetical protein
MPTTRVPPMRYPLCRTNAAAVLRAAAAHEVYFTL